MSAPVLPTPELALQSVPAPHPGTRRVGVALTALAIVGTVLAIVTAQQHSWLWVVVYAGIAVTAWNTWRARRWARPAVVALALLGTVPLAAGLVVGDREPLPMFVFGGAIVLLVTSAATLLTHPARTWFAGAAARRTLGD
ncbi:MAG: hypothetical protein MUF21_06525 [Gemmatimonadaceae bacterium]|nr:hypothetical protein [Gemmatimonadaceae bacterium]